MEPSNFSETQFVIGFLREYLDRSQHFWLNNFIRMPSTKNEKATGADLILKKKKVKGSQFFQFKRSDFLNNKRGLRRPQSTIDKNFFPCYRFKVYNDIGSEQFDTLRKLSRRNKNYCAYVAPLFHTYEEFDKGLAKREVMQSSIIIEVGQFTKNSFGSLAFSLKPGDVHHLLFNKKDSHCWFCSKPEKIRKEKSYVIKETLSGVSEISFDQEVFEINALLQEFEYPLTIEMQANYIWNKAKLLTQSLFLKNNIIWIPNFIN